MKFLKPSDKTAILFNNKTFTFTETLQYINSYARAFSQNSTPQKILIFADNSPEWIFAFYGGMQIGSILVPVDVQSMANDVAYIMNDCQPDCIFTSAEKIDVIESALEISGLKQCKIFTKNDIELSCKTQVKTLEASELDKTLMIIYTSGTTGSPKGVMISYRNVQFNCKAVAEDVKIYHENSNTLILLPLHHIFPLLGSMILPLSTNATVTIAEAMNAECITESLQKGKIRMLIGVPRLYELLANGIMTKINASFATRTIYKVAQALNSPRFSRLIFKSVHQKFGGHIEHLISGGAALPSEIGSVFTTLGFSVLEGYGMSETSPMVTFTRPWNIRLGYAGELLDGVEVKIAENNEICVRGDNVMQGYYNRPEETAEILRDGWLHTGDTGELEGKCIKITGRIKEIIVTSNGKNINPVELESEIMRQSACIREIGVFLKDNILQCIIVPEMSELRQIANENIESILKDEIEKFNQTAQSYKRIKRIHVSSSELPKTRLMKIQRFKLAELATETRKTKANDTRSRSEVYMLLKSYIDAETKSNAAEDDHFEIDLAMDSLSKVALLGYVENTFGLSLNESQLEELNNLGKLSAFIEQKSFSINSKSNEISWKEILSAKIQHFDFSKSAGVIQAFCSNTVKVLMHLVYRYKRQGKVELTDKPCIIVANHRSALDGYFITSKMRNKLVRNTFFFAKEKHLQSKFAQFIARKNNVILMDINKNVRESLQQMAAALRSGKNIIIFPEGTRSHDNNLLTFKDSFAILSKELNVPVVPVAISGSEHAVFNRINLPRPFAKIKVDFLKPIYPDVNSTTDNIRDKVSTIIAHHLMIAKTI